MTGDLLRTRPWVRNLLIAALVVLPLAAGLTASVLTPDSEILLTGHADGTVAFWNAESGEVTERFAAHRAAVTHVVATFGLAYSCGADGSIVRWQRFDAEASLACHASATGIASSLSQSLSVFSRSVATQRNRHSWKERGECSTRNRLTISGGRKWPSARRRRARPATSATAS